MSRTRFRPETDGYAFTNSWTFDPVEIVTLTQLVTEAIGVIEVILSPLISIALAPALAAEAGVPFIGPWLVYETIKKANDAIVNGIVGAIDANPYGLCGGMAFSSLDYFLKGWVVPRGNGVNDQPQRTSATGTALRDYIWNRLIKSIEDNVGTFLQWMAVLHFEGGPGASWLRDHTHAQLVTLRARIDAGTPVTIGLIGTTWNPLDNHQVLCYGYNNNGNGTTTLFLYDNNNPGQESTTTLDFSGSELNAVESVPSAARGPLRGLFCTSYGSQTPPLAVVLRSGLTFVPGNTGIGEAVGVQLSAANIGFHNSPGLQLLVAGDQGNVVQEAAAASLAETAARSFSSHLTFTTAGGHHANTVANLGIFAGIQITKQLPPEGNTQSAVANVLVFGERDIRAVTQSECEITNTAGTTVTLTCDTSDMGAGASFAWTVTGATVQGSATSSQVDLKLPDQVGASVTVKVKVTLADGAFTTGTYTFQTISAFAAGLQHISCQIAHMLYKAPFRYNPSDPDPDPDLVAQLTPGDLTTIRDAATSLVNAADAAIKANAPITLAPGVRSTLAGTLAPKIENIVTPAVKEAVITPKIIETPKIG